MRSCAHVACHACGAGCCRDGSESTCRPADQRTFCTRAASAVRVDARTRECACPRLGSRAASRSPSRGCSAAASSCLLRMLSVSLPTCAQATSVSRKQVITQVLQNGCRLGLLRVAANQCAERDSEATVVRQAGKLAWSNRLRYAARASSNAAQAACGETPERTRPDLPEGCLLSVGKSRCDCLDSHLSIYIASSRKVSGFPFNSRQRVPCRGVAWQRRPCTASSACLFDLMEGVLQRPADQPGHVISHGAHVLPCPADQTPQQALQLQLDLL